MAADLTATAAANAATRHAASDAVVDADGTGVLAAFRDAVAASAFSSNVFASKVVAYDDDGGVVPTIRVLGAEYAAHEGSWFVRRQAFESMWQSGDRFVYGAVNVAGMGLETFGSFCLVIDDPRDPAPEALGVFPGNTAARYATEAGDVQGDAPGEVTAWEDRQHLAVVELAHEVTPEADDWPAVVCRVDSWLEAPRTGALPLDALSEVRLRSSHLDRLRELRAAWFSGDPLPADEANQAAAYDRLRRWPAPLVTVED